MAANIAFDKYVFPASQMPEPEPGVLPGPALGAINPVSRVKDWIQPSGRY
jgi:hypothetical protein